MLDKTENRTAVLKIKLGASLTGPTKRLVADLHQAAGLFNVARNRMVRFWERYCEDHPEVLADGKLNLPKGFTTQLYHAGREAAPALSSIIVAAASNTILGAHLLKRTPWNHRGLCKRVWQAVLGNEIARPCFRECGLAAPNKTTKLSLGADHATLTFALWSKQASRKHTQGSCRLAMRLLPGGLKAIIRRVANGENDWRLCDSELVWKEGKRRSKGTWYYHMCYQRPPLPEKLNPERTAQLHFLSGEADKPFEVGMDTGFPWKLGDVAVLQAKYNQLETRRLVLRHGYRDAGSGRKGHGRERIESAIRPVSRQARMLMERFSKNVVAQVIKYCRRYECGTLTWDKPHTKAKLAGWFAAKGIPFDWTRFDAQLEHRCWLYNIRIVASAEVVNPKPETARKSKSKGGQVLTADGKVSDGKQTSKTPPRSRKGAKRG